MTPFIEHTGVVVPLDLANVDTDAIIPKQFLKAVTRTGLGDFLFDNWRYRDEGVLGMDCDKRPVNRDFVLNQPCYSGGSVLLARENFGSGSSREHAVWSLVDYGFRVVIAPSFADIFFSNCAKNGLPAITLAPDRVDNLFALADAYPGCELSVLLSEQTLIEPDGEAIHFDIEAGLKNRLLNGLDDISLSLQCADKIHAYEHHRKQQAPWLFPDAMAK